MKDVPSAALDVVRRWLPCNLGAQGALVGIDEARPILLNGSARVASAKGSSRRTERSAVRRER